MKKTLSSVGKSVYLAYTVFKNNGYVLPCVNESINRTTGDFGQWKVLIVFPKKKKNGGTIRNQGQVCC